MGGEIDNYVRLNLNTDELNAKALESTFERLHTLGETFQLETRLVAEKGRVKYYLGTSREYESTVRHAIRRLFPDETDIEMATPPALPDEPTAALTLRGRAERRDDWQTRLCPVFDGDITRIPLGTVVEVLADTDATVIYQTLLEPKADWRADTQLRIDQLKRNRDTPAQRFFDFLFGDHEVDPELEDADPSHRRRIRSIESTTPRHSFRVHVRAVAAGSGARAVLDELGNALRGASGTFYGVAPLVETAEEAVETVASQIETCDPPDEPSLSTRLKRRLPITANVKPETVADSLTAPNFCLLDGDSLTTQGRQALDVTPNEQTNVPRPDETLLSQYDFRLLLGYPLTSDGTPLSDAVCSSRPVRSLTNSH